MIHDEKQPSNQVIDYLVKFYYKSKEGDALVSARESKEIEWEKQK